MIPNPTRFWAIPDRPPSDPGCFVIPSYALKDRTLPTRPTRAQIELAVQWWTRFTRAPLILSTGDNQGLGITNARVMFEYAMSLGVPREHLIEEDRSRNTWENLLYSMQIIREQHLERPTLVTLDLYTRRAGATARKQGWEDFYWLSSVSAGEPAFGSKRFQTYSRLTILAYELAAMAYSKWVGWV
jgi:uncharacterized SAM-binding protein YcdF (DUF218 family)